jgi:hypothetical protein
MPTKSTHAYRNKERPNYIYKPEQRGSAAELRLRGSSTNWYFSWNQMWIRLQQQRLFQWLKFGTKFGSALDIQSYSKKLKACVPIVVEEGSHLTAMEHVIICIWWCRTLIIFSVKPAIHPKKIKLLANLPFKLKLLIYVCGICPSLPPHLKTTTQSVLIGDPVLRKKVCH